MHGGRGQRRVTTMAAKVAGYIKLAIEAGKANPAPPIGPALGSKVRFPSLRFLLFPSSVNFFLSLACRSCKSSTKTSKIEYHSKRKKYTSLTLIISLSKLQGVNIMAFCKEYNARTSDQPGMIIPVEITVFEDKSFTFILKTPPASVLLKKAAGVAKGAADPQKQNVGSVTLAQLEEIAKIKLPDLNCTKIESAMEIVKGTANNMGISVVEA